MSTRALITNSIDMHCHGVGKFDFTDIGNISLSAIEECLAAEERRVVLTLYLPRERFSMFLDFIEKYSVDRTRGCLPHIAGIAIEGPLLASHGGTPKSGVWQPDEPQWRDIAACGSKGLVYSVISPDFPLSSGAPRIERIVEMLLDGGVLPAPGHFTKEHPVEVAAKLDNVFNIVKEWRHCPTITDHIYNDMPRNFTHAWRTNAERTKREQDIKNMNLASWCLANISDRVGPVPATMIRHAIDGHVKIAINCDGEHVDLAIVARTIGIVGASNMLLMTDSIESARLGGQTLARRDDNTLLYQSDDIVAAGSQGVSQQINNLLSIGVEHAMIANMIRHVPENILDALARYHAE